MAQEARHGGHVSSAGDQEAGVGVPQGVDIQRSRKAVLLEDQLEAVYYLPEEYAKEVSLLRGDKHTSVSLPYFPEDQQEDDRMVNELKEKSILIWEKN